MAKMCLVLLLLGNVAFANDGSGINWLDSLFIMACAGLVLLMTPALGLFYSGMVSKKNVLSTTINCTILFGFLALQWVCLGYTLAFGSDNDGLIGDLNFLFLNGVGYNELVGSIPNALFMIFQMMFAVIAAAIITGSFVERMRFSVLVIFILLWSTFVYDPLAHWVWGGGWLMKIGSLDFAGGGVVHISAGVAGLVGCILLGKRRGYRTAALLPHSIPLSFLGAILLWIGWLGFNAGSALGVNSIAINAFITTNLAVAGSMLSWVCLEWLKFGKPTLLGCITGIIAGLVAITPAAGFVTPFASIVIGFISSILCFFAISFMKAKLGYDDSLDAFGLHGIGGIWGGIATGIFATSSVNPIVAADGAGEGLLYSGDFSLLGVQIIAVIASFVFSGVVSFIIFKVIANFMPIRVDETKEEEGLDESLHGELAYR